VLLKCLMKQIVIVAAQALFVGTLLAQSSATQVIVQAASPQHVEPTPARMPIGTLKARSAEVLVEAASAGPLLPHASPQPTIKPQPAEIVVQPGNGGAATAPVSANPAPAETPSVTTSSAGSAAIDPNDMIPKEKVVALVKRIHTQQAEIQENAIKINSQVYDISQMVQQAYMFSRRASK